jgi:hypothetical protein
VEQQEKIENEDELATRLLSLKERRLPVLAVKENRISLADIYSQLVSPEEESSRAG